MTLGHALAPPDMSEEINTSDPCTAVELEPVVPESARGSRLRSVPRPLRRAIGPVLLLALWQVLVRRVSCIPMCSPRPEPSPGPDRI